MSDLVIQDNFKEVREALAHNARMDDKRRRDTHVDGDLKDFYVQQTPERRHAILQAATTAWAQIATKYSAHDWTHRRVIEEAVDVAETIYLEIERRERGDWLK